jgi:hypothetical protein
MSATIQLAGAPKPEKLPCTMRKSPSAKITPGSYLSVAVRPRTRLNRSSRPGAMWALCWMYPGDQSRSAAPYSHRLSSESKASSTRPCSVHTSRLRELDHLPAQTLGEQD